MSAQNFTEYVNHLWFVDLMDCLLFHYQSPHHILKVFIGSVVVVFVIVFVPFAIISLMISALLAAPYQRT